MPLIEDLLHGQVKYFFIIPFKGKRKRGKSKTFIFLFFKIHNLRACTGIEVRLTGDKKHH